MSRRRQWLVGGVAVAAAGAGLVLSRRRSPPPDDGLWSLHFPTPDGGDLAMASFRGRPLVLNFWATWCPPCVREMPVLDRFGKDWADRGWQVLGLAIDNAAAVREFLRRTPVAFPIGLAGFDGTALARSLGNQTGGLPYTVVFDAAGEIRQRKAGETTATELETWARHPD